MFDDIFGWIGSLWSALSGLARHIFDYLKRTVLPWIIARVKDTQAFLNKYIGPAIRFVKAVRAWYMQYVFPYQHAVLEILSRVRAVLAVFRVLGFKWAAKLDADLQKVQSWVTQSILDVIQPLNKVLDFLDLIVDPGMIIRKDFFAASLFGSLSSLKRATAYGSNTPLTAQQQQQQADDKSLGGQNPNIGTVDASGNVTLSPAYQTAATLQRQAFTDVTGVAA